MKRSCETCEWGREAAPQSPAMVCREGPVPVEVRFDHWCGRWRLAERTILKPEPKEVA